MSTNFPDVFGEKARFAIKHVCELHKGNENRLKKKEKLFQENLTIKFLTKSFLENFNFKIEKVVVFWCWKN